MPKPEWPHAEKGRPVPLDYHTPDRPRPAGNVPYLGQLAIGFGAYLLAGVLAVPLAIVIGSLTRYDGLLRGWDAMWLFVWAVPIGCLVAVTVIAWRRWHWRGFLAGVLVGIGLTLLGVGACFVIVMATL